jgi:hypothetical protein
MVTQVQLAASRLARLREIWPRKQADARGPWRLPAWPAAMQTARVASPLAPSPGTLTKQGRAVLAALLGKEDE